MPYRTQKLRRAIEYTFSHTPMLRDIYWKYSPKIYRIYFNTYKYNTNMFDPIRLQYMNPDKISRFSGRKNARHERWKDVGKIMTGNWDQLKPAESSLDHPKRMFFSSIFEDTILYKSMYNKFKNNYDWEETKLYQSLSAEWGTEKAINECEKINRLYQRITEEGYKSQWDLMQNQQDVGKHISYLDLLADEVTVDISRNGDPLFVDGRHRLCIAKLLDIECIPICVLVRHERWVRNSEHRITEDESKR